MEKGKTVGNSCMTDAVRANQLLKKMEKSAAGSSEQHLSALDESDTDSNPTASEYTTSDNDTYVENDEGTLDGTDDTATPWTLNQTVAVRYDGKWSEGGSHHGCLRTIEPLWY